MSGATYSHQQTWPILVTKNCALYWYQQTFRKIREISADFMNPILVSTNFFSVLFWRQKTQKLWQTQTNKVNRYLLRNNTSFKEPSCLNLFLHILQLSELFLAILAWTGFFISAFKCFFCFQIYWCFSQFWCTN